MNTKKFFKNKYKELLYMTPMGRVIYELIKKNFDSLTDILIKNQNIRILAPAEKVAGDVLVALIWGLGLLDEDQEVNLTLKNCELDHEVQILQGGANIFAVVDIWLEDVLINASNKIEFKNFF